MRKRINGDEDDDDDDKSIIFMLLHFRFRYVALHYTYILKGNEALYKHF